MLRDMKDLQGDIMKLFAFNETMSQEERNNVGLSTTAEFPSAERFRKLFQSKSVAIVGNGPITFSMGTVIDQHAVVVRMNDFSLFQPYKVGLSTHINGDRIT